MKTKKVDEGIKSWIPGTAEFKAAGDEAIRKAKKDELDYNLVKLQEYEKLWRDTINKAEKNWKDRWILSNAGVWNEKDLEKLMAELRKTYIDDAEPLPLKDKEAFITFLLKMISLFRYI